MVVDWDARYAKGWAYGKAPSEFVVDAAARYLPQDGSQLHILSLGEGQGRNVAWLAAQGHACTGVDCSTVGLRKARRLAEERGVSQRVQLVEADLTSFDLGQGRWDCIVSVFCALRPADRVALHLQCVQALRPGGWLLLRTRSLGGRAAAAAETNTLGPQGLKSGANRRPMALLNWAPPGATSWAVARAAWCLPRRPAPASIAVRRGRRWQLPN